MRHGSLFSGIGGFDLAAEWMGWENVFHCEINPFGQKVLKHYWPEAKLYDDITKTDFTIHRGRIDILSGGFPCQPFSQAGQRKGTEDSRHLWPEMLRAIREIQPKWIVGENVYGIVNWNGGMVFDQVCADLEAEGYEVQPVILPACSVNAPHRRDRTWFIAKNTYYNGCDNFGRETESCKWEQRNFITGNSERVYKQEIASNSDINGFNGSNGKHEIHTSKGGFDAQHDVEQITMYSNSTGSKGKHKLKEGQRKPYGSDSGNGVSNWQNFPTQSPICSGNDGVPGELDGITFPKWRQESIKAYGNAVVPQLVYEIFKVIETIENNNA